MKDSGLRAAAVPVRHRPQMVFMPKQATGPPTSSSTPTSRSPARAGSGDPPARPAQAGRGCLMPAPPGCTAAYIYIRGEFIREGQALATALQEAYDAGLIARRLRLGHDLNLSSPWGRGLHLREETAHSRKSRGQEGPAAPEAAVPAMVGLTAPPRSTTSKRSRGTTILRRGPAWFAAGPPQQHRHQIFCISGP